MLTYLLTYLHNLDTGTVIDSHDMTAHLSLLYVAHRIPCAPQIVCTSYIRPIFISVTRTSGGLWGEKKIEVSVQCRDRRGGGSVAVAPDCTMPAAAGRRSHQGRSR